MLQLSKIILLVVMIVASSIDITMPYNYTPREYQIPFYNARSGGQKRGVTVWHRRAGKDKTYINFVAKEAMKRVAAYYYFFPTYNQGRKILWDGIDGAGFKFMGHFPNEIRQATNNTEMKITLTNGSIFQIIGSDNIDSVMGSNPAGCIFSEFSLQDPTGWNYMRPILAENGGWAYFNFTPRGKNHAYQLYKMAKKNPDWFCELLTVDDTGAISQEAIQAERDAGMSEQMIQQEFYCSFEAPVPGAYYAKEMIAAKKQGRITHVPIEPSVPVDTYWDLGYDDSCTIWFGQNIGRQVHFIGYYSNNKKGMTHYANYLKDWRDEHQVTFGTHVLPHDGAQHSRQTAKTDKEYLEDLGIATEIQNRPVRKTDALESVRQFIGRSLFDEFGCEGGITALRSYKSEYDEKNTAFKLRPVHDYASHGADGYQTAALWHESELPLPPIPDYGYEEEPHNNEGSQGWMA